MTPAEFQNKWSAYKGKESSAYQEHFNDLCRLLGHPTPADADPTGEEDFCFQKYVLKDSELLGLVAETPLRRGFADVWKRNAFAWEYKGKDRDLDAAYTQLLRYREALLNPPLLVVCDFQTFIIRTNFNGTVQKTYTLTLADLADKRQLQLLRDLFFHPESLKPGQTTEHITEELAARIAEVARSLQGRESIEYADAKTRKELNFAQRKNLRIARFLNRLIFCYFAEDTGLLTNGIFTRIIKDGNADPEHLAVALEGLFRTMATGGIFGPDKIRHFNGHLFDEATVFALQPEEIQTLTDAARADWSHVEPSIMGTLFERALDEDQRAALGAHYTHPDDIKLLVEPVLMAPLRRDWQALKKELLGDYRKGKKGSTWMRNALQGFVDELGQVTVLDPACGSGNFLYVSLQLLLGLEKEVVTFAARFELTLQPAVGVHQLRAIELNPYAFELAQVSVQIGYLQWRRANGYRLDQSPVLQNLDGFENADALMREVFKRRPKDLQEAQAGEHGVETDTKAYIEKVWPDCKAIVGNPPFLGGKMLRRNLGDAYVDELFTVFKGRVPAEADLCCYWFEKARAHIEDSKCRRAGLLATQGIRGKPNREVLSRIRESGDIFFAESDREWFLQGANVHVSMVGFDDGSESKRILNGNPVKEIAANLSAQSSANEVNLLSDNQYVSFMGITPAGNFEAPFEAACGLLTRANPNGRPSSDVLRPYLNGRDLNQRSREQFTVDFHGQATEADAAGFEEPFALIQQQVKPERLKNRREVYAKKWWQYAESRPAMRVSFSGHARYLATCMVAKHRLFVWLPMESLPANVVIVFARSDDYFFGVLHSRFHEIWALEMGTQLETRPRYTPTTCFETFPFPVPTPEQHEAIAAAAKELSELRENWLNPEGWTREEILEFPATEGGPWDRYLDRNSVKPSRAGVRIGTARYPRRVPVDAAHAAQLKDRTLTKLYNARPPWLDLAHKKLDAAVAAAYAWPPDLPEPEILTRLLALNLARAKSQSTTPTVVREKPVPQRGRGEGEML
jgi:hypothetical protein